MHSPRILRSIEAVLDQAEAAVARADWDAAIDGARRVLAIDPTNQDAAAFLRMAQADLDVIPLDTSATSSAIESPSVAPSLVMAIEDEVRARESVDAAVSETSPSASAAAVAAADRFRFVPGNDDDDDIASPGAARFRASATGTDGPSLLTIPRIATRSEIVEAPDLAADADAAPGITAPLTSRRRRYIVVGAYDAPRRFVPLSARGPLVLTAGILVATIALTLTGPARPQPSLLAQRVADPAPTSEAAPAPALVLPTPAPVEAVPVVSAPAPVYVESSAPVAAITPAIVLPPPLPKPRQYRGAFAGTLGTVVAINGCTWNTPFEASVDATLTASDGALSGSATSLVRIAYIVTHTPPGAICNGSTVTTEASGAFAGDEQHLSASLSGPRELAISFVGARTGEALIGNVTLQRSLGTLSTFGHTTVTSTAAAAPLVLAGS